MAETAKKPTEKPTEKPSVAAGRAAESGDPAVHQLLAERQTHALNGDAAAVAEIDARLTDLGFAEYAR